MTANNDCEVGYRKPPKAHQFKQGKSGNPAGRKKGSFNHSELLAKAMNEKVSVTVKGRRRSMTKLELAFKQQMNLAAEGDRHAVKLMMGLLNEQMDRDGARQAGPEVAQERKAREQLILAALGDQRKTLLPEAASDD